MRTKFVKYSQDDVIEGMSNPLDYLKLNKEYEVERIITYSHITCFNFKGIFGDFNVNHFDIDKNEPIHKDEIHSLSVFCSDECLVDDAFLEEIYNVEL
jgi:hypothetical protein